MSLSLFGCDQHIAVVSVMSFAGGATVPAVAIKLVASLAGDNDDRPVAVHRRRGGSLETDGRRVQRHERVTHGGHDGQGLRGSLRVGDGGGGNRLYGRRRARCPPVHCGGDRAGGEGAGMPAPRLLGVRCLK